MNDIPLSALFLALAILILLSGFFSGSETALMTLNRYRLRHRARDGDPKALRVEALLKRPDRLIGLILLGNNFVNIFASSIATVIAIELGGEGAIPIAAALLTLIILIFAEVAPKTLAALKPDRLAYPAAIIYVPLLKLLYPFVWLVNSVANGLLKRMGVASDETNSGALSQEELRTLVHEGGNLIPKRHQKMLLSILDLEKVRVDDIMVPRNEIVAIDLSADEDDILKQLQNTFYSRLPVYDGSLDNVLGFVHVRNLLRVLLKQEEFSKEIIRTLLREPYFIPENTPLNTQLINFQKKLRRLGLVVDEYGDVLGLVTLADLLEEIVGEFTTDPTASLVDVHPQEDGSFLVSGSATLRDLVRTMHWELPTDGPKTLNGLILEYMETIPETGTSLMLAGYPMEVVQTKGNAVRTVRISPHLRRDNGAG
ncbi:MAG: HlyC/CorC family transporter [Gammaproteobacteria bacterium]|nr:HlyC/CorC family transporter [Gammaproteobacteria bacterium]MBU1654127.1 HlyC/CorC family transporter [Gammaproteobacteria bacterium]MBU1960143.1 HlyC/CorC family transporter [Gammaproteobacteria bacterium]